jgi:lipid II:glycine glycyltransferase (peptidoglycan interpeptide bridge formation enzyme)
LSTAIEDRIGGTFKYAEIRPRSLAPDADSGWKQNGRYHLHTIDLSPSTEELRAHLHRDGVQRKIRRADRENVAIDQGRSERLLQQFYGLLLLTRRRHGLPPQPMVWFRNLIECLGTNLTIHVARIGDRPIASILTLNHKKTLVYKYGCSDERFHNLGGMPRLFWQAIEGAKSDGLKEFDLGRSDEDNPGLVRFKDHLGAARTSIYYWRYPAATHRDAGLQSALRSRLIQNLLPRLPDGLFRLAGEIFYRHAS